MLRLTLLRSKGTAPSSDYDESAQPKANLENNCRSSLPKKARRSQILSLKSRILKIIGPAFKLRPFDIRITRAIDQV
ncbi:hypothetical protein Pst134EB_006565 [Puccinia striiformis f. sp. tritici]|nr:hypothetical protein Pst134EB_006565 [Puccinia striiformis f. sp. tritici]